jgi:hypothetical protein
VQVINSSATAFVGGVILQLFGLDRLRVLASAACMLALVTVGEDHIFLDQFLLQVGEASGSAAFSSIFRGWPKMLAIFA